VLVPRRIAVSEIRAIRQVHRVTGWRYFPEAQGKPPFCGCSYCQRGNIKSRKIRDNYQAALKSSQSAYQAAAADERREPNELIAGIVSAARG